MIHTARTADAIARRPTAPQWLVGATAILLATLLVLAPPARADSLRTATHDTAYPSSDAVFLQVSGRGGHGFHGNHGFHGKGFHGRGFHGGGFRHGRGFHGGRGYYGRGYYGRGYYGRGYYGRDYYGRGYYGR